MVMLTSNTQKHKAQLSVLRRWTVLGLVCCLPTQAFANLASDDLFIDEDELEIESLDIAITKPQTPLEKWLLGDNKFTLQQDFSYQQDATSQGVQTNRSWLRLEWSNLYFDHFFVKFDGKVVSHWINDRQAEAQDEEIYYRFPLRELYLQASWQDVSFTFGRQVVIWGESEIAAVTDVISPRNVIDFYFTSLDESRLGQTLASLDYYHDYGHFTLLAIPNPKTDVDPVLDSNYDIDGLDISQFNFQRDESDLTTEFGFRWKKAVGIGDFSLMLADLASNEVLYFIDANSTISESSEEGENRIQRYPRYQFIGGAANLAVGEGSLALELAYKKGLDLQSTDQEIGVTERNTVEVAASYSWEIMTEQTVFIGASNQHIAGNVTELEDPYQDINDLSFGWTGQFLYQQLTISYNYQYQFQDKNTIHTLSSRYSVSDNFFLNAELYLLSADDKEVFSFFDQDSVILRAEYNF
ncbi:hypothetical protein C2869_04210 [Saccharobesus litoralis]|uniref:Uncharacterized protein n=1 Tax=Saccharobesus litoralis TaxID=2172099 RepID=A0A2S0VNE1_9ALTE|nr:DUF1302 family protein [Saccharobesus litoralis]AWB65689.1 hypothetical protein C2869_04210 [Saccharobesus litoralis]